MYLITPSQCRAARALLNWSQPELAERCDMNVQTISAFESETSTPTKRTLEKITAAFEVGAIEFLPHEGVRKNVQSVKTYVGADGYRLFKDDVCSVLSCGAADVCVSNVDERELLKLDHLEYVGRMEGALKRSPYSFRMLVQEGDSYFPASSYASYRWIESRYFHTVPFYVYGNKLAIIYFKQGPTIHVVENKDIADAQRIQFNIMWDSAKVPPPQ